MSPITSNEVVARAPASKEQDPPKLVKEPVRFAFHTIGISLSGILALTLDPLIATYLLIIFVFISMSGEFLRCNEQIQQWPNWTLLSPLARLAASISVREHELGTRSATLDFFLAFAITWTFCTPEVVAVACFITAWADPLARVVGKNWGKTKWPRSQKTPIGSGACWLVATIVCAFALLVQGRGLATVVVSAVIVGLCTALAELIPQYPSKPKPGDILTPADNFWLMIIVSMAIVACTSFLP